jgi:hypothetical protein
MYHPAAALHQGSLRGVLEQDFRALPMIITRAKTKASTPVAATTAAQPALLEEVAAPEQMSLF